VSLVVIAPSQLQARDRAWLAAAARRSSVSLAPDGIVYVLARPRPRRRLRKALRAHGLESVEGFLHVPDVRRSRFLVPLQRRPLRHALAELVPLSTRNRPLAAAVAALPTTRALELLAGPVGLAARRASAPGLFGWLQEGGGSPTAIVELGAEEAGRMTLHVFSRSARSPSFVAKLGGDPARHSAGAAATVDAGAAGVAVPRPLPPLVNEEPVWRETALSGTNAAAFLRRRPARLRAVVEPLVTWLDEWQQRTASESDFGPELLDQWVREPLAALESSIDAGGAYESRLEALGRGAARRVPLVTMHGDLTMANVLVRNGSADGAPAVGVVDWEAARPGALPLLDLFYMLADAVAAVGGYEDRPAAARECFSPGGRFAPSTSSARLRLARTLRLSDDVTALSFHACWLHHAANEARARQPDEPRPFLEIVNWVAQSRELLPGLAIP
jgi:hypothetical protein